MKNSSLRSIPRFSFTLLLTTLALFYVSTTIAHAAVTPDDPGNFITTWNTENPGTSNDDQITIPHANGSTYNYEIYWVNTASSTMTGTTTVSGSNRASSPTLTFPEPGIYEVQASGTFPHIVFAGGFGNGGDKDKILTVEQWGNIAWTSMASAFQGASNLRVPATDAPNLSGVTSLALMFMDAAVFNDPINHWDVSNVQNFGVMFLRTNFDQTLNNWDVSSATSLGTMFGATPFNQNINIWDVSKVTDFRGMFAVASKFNQPLDQWDTASGTDMINMFFNAESFNQDISMWDLSSVEGIGQMFRGATSFNQPLNNWDVSNVTNMKSVFSEATAFNQPLDQWDTSSVTEFGNCPDGEVRGMFYNTPFNQDLSSWDISSTTCMNYFFLDSSLSQSNLDNTLTSWASQSLQNDVPFHLGLKTYSTTGAQALQTLTDTYNWTITEQYQARYRVEPDATLTGSNHQFPLNSGATTTPVEVKPNTNCTFRQWSDGNTENPRQDVLTDNLTVTAEIRCSSGSSGSSASGRAAALERQGKDEEAAAIRERYNLDDRTTTSTPSTYQPPETLEESLDEVEQLPETIDRIVANDPSPETIRSLIGILLSLVEALGQLLASGEGA